MRTRQHGTSIGDAEARPDHTGRGRTRGFVRLALLAGVAVGVLAGCQDGVGGAAGPAPAWTEAEIAAVFDLSELGRLSAAPSGDHLMLAGRALPAAVVERFPHLTIGRGTNLLAFDDDALAAMSDDARRLVEHAAPGELRAMMREHGLTMEDVHAAWTLRGRIGLGELFAVAERMDGRSVEPSATDGIAAGARLLDALGVAR
jgi:hypothetical protein